MIALSVVAKVLRGVEFNFMYRVQIHYLPVAIFITLPLVGV